MSVSQPINRAFTAITPPEAVRSDSDWIMEAWLSYFFPNIIVFSENQVVQNPLAHLLHEHSIVLFSSFRVFFFLGGGKHHRPRYFTSPQHRITSRHSRSPRHRWRIENLLLRSMTGPNLTSVMKAPKHNSLVSLVMPGRSPEMAQGTPPKMLGLLILI